MVISATRARSRRGGAAIPGHILSPATTGLCGVIPDSFSQRQRKPLVMLVKTRHFFSGVVWSFREDHPASPVSRDTANAAEALLPYCRPSGPGEDRPYRAGCVRECPGYVLLSGSVTPSVPGAHQSPHARHQSREYLGHSIDPFSVAVVGRGAPCARCSPLCLSPLQAHPGGHTAM